MKKLILLAALVAVFLLPASAQAVELKEIRPLQDYIDAYPVYITIETPFGARQLWSAEDTEPNGWAVGNPDVETYAGLARRWMLEVGIDDEYEMVEAYTYPVRLMCPSGDATPDYVVSGEWTGIFLTLKEVKKPVEIIERPTAPAPVQLPATGESDAVGLFAAAVGLLVLGIASRRM